MKVSVVVCTKNEEKFIGRCLRALKNQTVKPEIIVVDGHSTDKTVKIAKKYTDKVILDKGKGIGDARNIGWKNASGNIVAYCDADAVPKRDWVEKIINNIGDNIAVYGPIEPYDGNKFTKKKMKIFGYYFMKLMSRINYPTFCAANLAVKKSVLKKYPFRFGVIEDFDLGNRLRKVGRIKFVPDLVMPVSSRRYEKGFMKTALRDYLLNWFRIKIEKEPKVGNYFKSK